MKESKALQEVWAMKAAAYAETKHLRGPALFAYIHRQVAKLIPASVRLRRIAGGARRVRLATKVAEASAPYRVSRRKQSARN
jgi:hypothetical protein